MQYCFELGHNSWWQFLANFCTFCKQAGSLCYLYRGGKFVPKWIRHNLILVYRIPGTSITTAPTLQNTVKRQPVSHRIKKSVAITTLYPAGFDRWTSNLWGVASTTTLQQLPRKFAACKTAQSSALKTKISSILSPNYSRSKGVFYPGPPKI